jgi:Fe-S-cluster containining protein
LKSQKPAVLDVEMKESHDQVFSQFDCLSCAQCCKTTGPLFTPPDITRLSKHLKLKEGAFVNRFLRIDEEGDYVLQSVPCPFLQPDNACGVYDHRPKACREYPHTDRKRQHEILKLTEKNVAICPAAEQIVQRVFQQLNKK